MATASTFLVFVLQAGKGDIPVSVAISRKTCYWWSKERGFTPVEALLPGTSSGHRRENGFCCLFQIKWFGWIADRQPGATLFHLLPMTTENVISILTSIFSISTLPWPSKNQTTDCDNKLDFEARLLFMVIQSLKRSHNFSPFHLKKNAVCTKLIP